MGDWVRLTGGYEWRKSVSKGLRTAVMYLGGLALLAAANAVLGALTDQATVERLLGSLAKNPIVVASVIAAAEAARNWIKNRNR